MLYTILPTEYILQGIEEMQNYKEVEVRGVKLLVRPCGENEAEIMRIIDSDPKAFLNPFLQPGQKLTFVPCLKENEL